MSEPKVKMSESDVIRQILARWPGLGSHAGYVLWNHTCFPFGVGDEPLAHWMKQVEEYIRESAMEWQRLHG